MPYLSQFAYDLFVSYAHVDNLAQGADDGWVDHFHKELKQKLAQRVGRIGLIEIWRDPSLDGSQVFDTAIKNRIESVAVFVALNSRGYAASSYCLKELEWFHQRARQSGLGVTVGERTRVVNVLLTNMPPADWRDEFQGASGFSLHDAVDDEQIGEPTEPGSERFKHQLRTLADSIFRTLEILKSRETEAPAAETGADSRASVFIADVADSLQLARDRLRSDLVQKGLAVWDDVPPPYENEKHDEQVAAALSHARISVHLLDELEGRRMPNQAGTSYPCRQVELALGTNTPQLIWVPSGLKAEDIPSESHREFLEGLEEGSRERKSYDFVRGHPETVTEAILEIIARSKRDDASTPASDKAVLLDTHPKDQRFAFKLGDYLDSLGIQPYIHQDTGDPGSSLRAFEDEIGRVGKLMVFFGEVSERWVKSRVECALQFVARQFLKNARPTLDAIYVCLLPPTKQSEPDFPRGVFQVQVVNTSHLQTFDPREISSLFPGLVEGGAA